MAADAISRADDGLEGNNRDYAMSQMGKATYYLSEAWFNTDLELLTEEKITSSH